ncbi:helix-turn-helix domain-containing protein [Streptomyces xanthochromogenes]|uniref:HTH cro/C1-type domain-containing protein n=1 Tax=Streptomyces xanthochromogenes TaxID=67384 RepID=A0ABQ3A1I8_9ACTN|nr:helix-turn-helix transcriptional regulator [Streptomyces xanthochromogenes]GGY29438.1 hypothetical protein GCM10010326_24100 [Streptomyces xanthochromogenes]
MSTRVRLAGRIIEAREEAKLSQRALAGAAGMSPSVLSRIEDASRLPSMEQLRDIMSVLEDHAVGVDTAFWYSLLENAAALTVEMRGGFVQVNQHVVPFPDVQMNRSSSTGDVRLWDPLRRSLPSTDTGPHDGAPDPTLVSTLEELMTALNEVLVWSGAPSLRQLEIRSKKTGYRLSKSTIGEMLKRPKLPPYERYQAFLTTCGITEFGPWLHVWRRLKLLERGDQIGA